MGLLRNRLRDRIRPPLGPPPDMPPTGHAPDAPPQPGAPAPPPGAPPARTSLGSSAGSVASSGRPKKSRSHARPPHSPGSSAEPPPSPHLTLPRRVAGSFSQRVYGGGPGARRAASTDTSARSTVRDHASRLRRLLRDTVGSRNSDASMQLDDVPDTADPFPDPLSDAAFSIAAAAGASSPPPQGHVRRGSLASPVGTSSSSTLGASAQQYQQYRPQAGRGGGCGGSAANAPHLALPLSAVQRGMPNEIGGGETCSDGVISFVVPRGWVATRTMDDSFCLVNGLSLGFVRAVAATGAAEALLETGRLQVMSHVTALSSPVFVEDEVGRVAAVDYLSTMGRGRGVAVFPRGGGGGCAVVFALCGPSEEQAMIEASVEQLRRTATPPSRCAEAARKGEAVAVRKDSEERKSVISDMPGLSESLAKLEEDLKPKQDAAAAATCMLQ